MFLSHFPFQVSRSAKFLSLIYSPANKMLAIFSAIFFERTHGHRALGHFERLSFQCFFPNLNDVCLVPESFSLIEQIQENNPLVILFVREKYLALNILLENFLFQNFSTITTTTSTSTIAINIY